MSGKDKPEDALLEALDSLTNLIAERQNEGLFPLSDERDLDLEGLEFGPAVHDDDLPLLDKIIGASPSPKDIAAIVERYLELRLPLLREQLKREILFELRKRFPNL